MLLVVGVLSACQTANERAMIIGKAPENAVALRAMQSRRFDTADDKTLLTAATQTLQDLGFTISESAGDVGVLVASKQRNAEESGQVAAQIGLMIFAAALGSYHSPTWDREQTIRVTLAAVPVSNGKQTEVRASFDRVLTNNHGYQWRAELLMEQDLYQQFFEKLAASAFLEAQKV